MSPEADEIVEVIVQVRRSALLGGDPEKVRKELGEGAYRAALRKLDPPSPEEGLVKRES